MCNSSALACGMSHAMNGTPDSISPETKWTLRASLSSFAIRSVAPVRRHSAIAAARMGRDDLRPLSVSDGDTPTAQRRRIRNESNLVLSNR